MSTARKTRKVLIAVAAGLILTAVLLMGGFFIGTLASGNPATSLTVVQASTRFGANVDVFLQHVKSTGKVGEPSVSPPKAHFTDIERVFLNHVESMSWFPPGARGNVGIEGDLVKIGWDVVDIVNDQGLSPSTVAYALYDLMRKELPGPVSLSDAQGIVNYALADLSGSPPAPPD